MLRVKNKYYVNLLDLNHKTGKKLSLYIFIFMAWYQKMSLLQYRICRIVLQYGNILYSSVLYWKPVLLPLHNVQYEKNTDLSGRPIRKKYGFRLYKTGKNNVRSHVLNGCFWLDWNYSYIIISNIVKCMGAISHWESRRLNPNQFNKV
jgi:hypothetical protein